MNTEGFKPNLETQLVPLFATKVEEAETRSEDKKTASSSLKNAHHSLLLQVLIMLAHQSRICKNNLTEAVDLSMSYIHFC